MKTVLLFALITLFPIFISAQTQAKWSIIFGSEEFTGLNQSNTPEDLQHRIVQALDHSGYYMSGTNNYGSGEPKPNTIGAYIAKFDNTGKLLWWNCPSIDWTYYSVDNIQPGIDGGIITAGLADKMEYVNGKKGIVIFKHDKNGSKTLEKIIENDELKTNSVNVESGGLPILISEINPGVFKVLTYLGTRIEFKRGNLTVSDQSDTLAFIEYNATTNKVSTTFLNESFSGDVQAINSNNNETIIYRFKDQWLDVWKYSSDYKSLWHYTEKFNCDYVTRCTVNANDELVVAMYSILTPNCADKGFILKLNNKGEKTFSLKTELPLAMCWVQEKNNTFYGVYNDENNIGKFNFIAMDSNGKTKWQKIFGQKNTSGAKEIITTNDNGFLILAGTQEFGAKYIDAWIIKTDKDGNTEALPKKYQKKAGGQ